jgi:predicted GIY-YIG superfamily endonuclease
MEQAILREKRIKKWLRRWKIELIEKDNPVGGTGPRIWDSRP